MWTEKKKKTKSFGDFLSQCPEFYAKIKHAYLQAKH
jgi:hypothetical protein